MRLADGEKIVTTGDESTSTSATLGLRPADLFALLLVAALYLLAAKLGLKLAFVHASATAVWPPAGIALAALLLRGYGMWPAVFIGAFVANITTAGSLGTSLGIAAGNTLERSEERRVGKECRS